MRTDDLERRLAEEKGLLTPEERKALERTKASGDKASYGHDLIGAIQRGYARRIEATFDDAADLLQGDLYLQGVEWTPERAVWHVSPERAVWHVLNRASRWALKRGMSMAWTVDALRRIADSMERSKR